MNRRLRVCLEAEAEITSAAQWYESKRPGLGVEFMATLDRALDEVLDNPAASALWREGHPFRKHVLRRFPFVVFLKATEEAVEIVAVAHEKRRPGYWLDR